MSLTKRVNKGNESNWRSFSDVMTGLMVIFMFIAISYINEVQKKQQQRDIIFEEFKATKEEHLCICHSQSSVHVQERGIAFRMHQVS